MSGHIQQEVNGLRNGRQVTEGGLCAGGTWQSWQSIEIRMSGHDRLDTSIAAPEVVRSGSRGIVGGRTAKLRRLFNQMKLLKVNSLKEIFGQLP